MKKFILSIATAMILVFTSSSFALAAANPLKNLNSLRIIEYYADAISLGNVTVNTHLFAEDFEYQNAKNNIKANKKQYSKFLKANQGLKFDCTTKYELLDETGNSCIAKVTLDFGHFQRVDYITLKRQDQLWQVSKVITTYP